MAARQRLTAKFVAEVKEPGTYGDGGHGSHGLALRVRPASGGGVTKSWVQRLIINGKPTHIGLGPTWLCLWARPARWHWTTTALCGSDGGRTPGKARLTNCQVPELSIYVPAGTAREVGQRRPARSRTGPWAAQPAWTPRRLRVVGEERLHSRREMAPTHPCWYWQPEPHSGSVQQSWPKPRGASCQW